MFKKTALALVLAGCSINAFADGFYLAPAITEHTITSNKSSFRGISPRLSLGYNFGMGGCLSMAAELFGSPFSIPLNDNKAPGAQSAKMTRNFGASILPAYQLNDSTFGYFRLGVINAKFSGPNKTSTGGQFGLGMQTRYDDSWDIRGEYTYNVFKSVSGLGSPKMDMFALSFVRKLDFCD